MSEPDAALHEFINMEIAFDGRNSPMDEQKLRAALEGREGIKRAQISNGKLHVEYEPVCIHKSQILGAIAAAGFRITATESAQASPVIDALHDQK